MLIFYLVVILGLGAYLGSKFGWFSKMSWPKNTGSGLWSGVKSNWSLIITVILLGFLGYWIFWDQFPLVELSTTIILLIILGLAAIFHSSKWYIAIGLVGMILLYQVGCDGCNSPDSAGKKPTEITTEKTTEALVLVTESYVAPGIMWTTPTVDFKFKFRAEGHAYSLKFTGMDYFKDYPKEGDFLMPEGAQPGPIIVKAGSGETEPFRVQLYKKIQVKL